MNTAYNDSSAARGGPVGTKEVVHHLHGLGFHYQDIALAVGAAPRSVSNWAAGQPPQRTVEDRLMALYQLAGMLEEMFDPRTIGQWFRTPNRWLEWRRPLDLLQGGDRKRVEDTITAILAGYTT